MQMKNKKAALMAEMHTKQYYVIFLSCLSAVVTMIVPWLLGQMIDILGNGDNTKIIRRAIVIITFVVIQFFLDWLQNYQWCKMLYLGETAMRVQMFQGIAGNPYLFFQRKKNGDLANRVLNDAGQYADNCLITIPMLVVNGVTILVDFAFIFYYNIVIGMGLLITCVLYFYSYKEINKKLRKYAKEERKEYSELLNTTTSFFEGIPTIRLYMQEQKFVEKYKRKADRFSEQSIHLQLWKSLTLALSGFILEMMPVITIILGVIFVARGQCTIGSVFAIYSYTSYLNEPIRNLTDLNLGRQQAKVNEQRLEELLVNEKQAVTKEDSIRSIKLDQVSFSYDDEKTILQKFDMEIHKGDRIGIIGNSGCGKTTLIHMLAGEIEPLEGKILVNGIEQKISSYRSKIAVLPQDVFLYDDTIINNICFGREGITKHEIFEVLDIEHFQEQSISELSGGERRRVGLARALLGDFEMLILDEPTAEIDSKMEEKIITLLNRIIDNDKIVVLITHRPRILDICNQIVRVGEL